MSSESKKTTLNVEGMTCSNCAAGITRHLSHKGFKGVNTNFATGEVAFQVVEETQVKVAIEEINSLGYKVIDKAAKPGKGISSIEIKFYISLLFTVPLLAHMVIDHHWLHNKYVQLVLCTPVFLIGLVHFGRSAWGSIKAGSANMDVLVMTGSASAYIYSCIQLFNVREGQVFFETCASIICFVLLGNLIEHISIRKTTSAIEDLTRLQPETANILEAHDGHEHIKSVPVESIRVNDIVIVNTGDRFPVDGVIVSGNGSVNEAMISGEPVPVPKEMNDPVSTGTILIAGNLRVRTSAAGENTALARIIEMVKRAQDQKPGIQKLGDRVSSIFVPVVLSIALVTFITWFIIDGDVRKALMNSIAVLVISCPCAMGLATPTAVMVGIGRAAKKGILIKGGNTIEELASIDHIVFDKTGTLTSGEFVIRNINFTDEPKKDFLRNILYSLEQRSSHPIAESLRQHLKSVSKTIDLQNVQEKKGFGITGEDSEGNKFSLGSHRFVSDIVKGDDHSLYLVMNGQLAATIDIEDSLRPGAANAIAQLNNANVTTVMVSGDRKKNCERVARETGIKEVYSEKLPEEKLQIIEDLAKKGQIAMAGDGINDAPALSRAQVGISLSDASDIAMNASQVILLRNGEELRNIPEAVLISRKTLQVIKQNLFWAFFYNVIAIPVAAFGFLDIYGPLIGALSMAFSDVVVIGNSLRLRSVKLGK